MTNKAQAACVGFMQERPFTLDFFLKLFFLSFRKQVIKEAQCSNGNEKIVIMVEPSTQTSPYDKCPLYTTTTALEGLAVTNRTNAFSSTFLGTRDFQRITEKVIPYKATATATPTSNSNIGSSSAHKTQARPIQKVGASAAQRMYSNMHSELVKETTKIQDPKHFTLNQAPRRYTETLARFSFDSLLNERWPPKRGQTKDTIRSTTTMAI